MTSIIVLGSNRYGDRVYNWLTNRDEANVLCMVTEESQYDVVKELGPDLLVCAGFKYIIPREILDLPELGTVNLHASYLPYNRGYNPSYWSIVEDVPAGATVHYVTEALDSGPIIDREEVEVRPDDTGKSLYERLEDKLVELFKENWEAIRTGTVETTEQPESCGTHHYRREFIDECELDLEDQVTAGEFIDRLRALTFPPYRNAYFTREGETYYVDLDVVPESESRPGAIHWNLAEYEGRSDD